MGLESLEKDERELAGGKAPTGRAKRGLSESIRGLACC